MECDRYQPVEGKPCFHYVRDCEGQPGFCVLSNKFRCIKAIEHFAPRQSLSSINSWKTCKRMYLLSNLYGLSLREKFQSKPLLLGTIMGAVMQKVWGDGIYDLDAALFVADSHFDNQYLDNHDRARLRAIIVALSQMGFKPLRSECEKEVLVKITGGHYIMGKKDAQPDPTFFVEFKYTKSPDRYLDVWGIADQVGMYFLSDPQLQFVVMAPIRNPDLKKITKKELELSPEEFFQKTLDDILGRPSFYFPGWNGSKGRWGKVFYRSEFDLIEVEETARIVAEEIIDAAKKGERYFYKNHANCIQYGRECDFISICKTNAIDEIRYKIRLDKKKATIWPGQEMLEQMHREEEKNNAPRHEGDAGIPEVVIEQTTEHIKEGKEETNSGVKESGGDSQVGKNDTDLRGERYRENYELFSNAPEAASVPAKRAKKPKR